MDAQREALDLAREFSADGRSYVELDDDGRVVRREPSDEGWRSAIRAGLTRLQLSEVSV